MSERLRVVRLSKRVPRRLSRSATWPVATALEISIALAARAKQNCPSRRRGRTLSSTANDPWDNSCRQAVSNFCCKAIQDYLKISRFHAEVAGRQPYFEKFIGLARVHGEKHHGLLFAPHRKAVRTLIPGFLKSWPRYLGRVRADNDAPASHERVIRDWFAR